MKKFSVVLMAEAEDDLVDLYNYIPRHHTVEKAERILENIDKVVTQLETLPLRGNWPTELERIGIRDYREVFYKPYRIIYQITGTEVYVYCILDGRRDMQTLLQQRLLRP